MNLNFDDIYPDVHDIADTVHIEHISNTTGRPVCIFGILESKQGLLIRDEMLSWLKLEYDVWCVYQRLPGRLFEYPALRFAQYMSIQDNIDRLLYVHTKGAANNSEIQKRIRTLWRHEFTGSRTKLYINDNADVVCPFCGTSKETWYNGMFISKHAFESIGRLVPSHDRYDYQRLFRNCSDVTMKGLIKNNINCVDVNTYMLTTDVTIKNRCPDFTQALIWTPKKH